MSKYLESLTNDVTKASMQTNRIIKQVEKDSLTKDELLKKLDDLYTLIYDIKMDL